MLKKVKTILVTGATGFIGKKLVTYLDDERYNVELHTHQQGDITAIDLNSYKADHVVHLAAKTLVSKSFDNPYEYYQTNILGTAKILEYCRIHGANLTLLSTYIYGIPQWFPVGENHPANPNTPYHHSKLMAENICEKYYTFFGVNVTILRSFNVYGEGQQEDFLVPYVLKQYLDADCNMIEVMNLKPKRDYLYIDDLLHAISLTFSQTGYHIYNVGSGISHSVEDVIKIINKVGHFKKSYREKNIRRIAELDDVVANTEKIKMELGWKPTIDLEKGLTLMLNSALK